MSRDAWTVARAKAKFSELIEKAKSEGPQKITKHGRTAVVIVATEEGGEEDKAQSQFSGVPGVISITAVQIKA